MTKNEIAIDVLKVFGVHTGAVIITFSNVEGFFKLLSLGVAIGYGIWKWRVDYIKNKNGTQGNS